MRTLIAVGVLCSLAVPCAAADPPVKTDRYGDPLPTGALMRLGTLRNRDPITGFGIEKDGTVVTVGPAADVRRWHAADDKSDEPIPLPLKGTETHNNAPQVSPDGKFVAACSDEKVFVWEVPAGPKVNPKEVAAFEIARTRLFRFAPDGTKLVVTTQGNEFCTVHVCDIKTGKRTDLDCTPRYVEGAHFSGDGKRLGVVAEADFYFLDAVTGKQLAKYRPDGRMYAIALNHTGDVMAGAVDFSGPRSEFRCTDPLTGKTLNGLTGPAGSIHWLTYAADGKTLLVGGAYGIRWWDPTTAKQLRAFEGITSEPYALQRTPARFSPDGKMVVAHNGSALLRWDAATGKPLFPEQDLGHGGHVSGVGVSADGKWIATRGMDSRVCVWDAATGKAVSHAPASWLGSPGIDFSPDGKVLYVGGPEWGEVTKLDTATGKEVVKFTTDPKGPKQASVHSVRLAKDGKTVFGLTSPYVAGDPGFVTEWDASTGARTKVTQMPFESALGGELSPGALFVARGHFGRGGVVAVVAPEKDLLAAANVPGFSFVPGHFSDDAKWVAQIFMEQSEGGLAHTARVISTFNWGVACTIPLTKNGRVGLSPDGRTLAVGAGDELDFYDTTNAKRIGGYRVPAGDWEKSRSEYIHVLRFTPDGTKLITGHADTTALVWPVPARPAK